MGNELAVVDAEKHYLALQEGGAVIEAMNANMGEDSALRESDLTRVTTPSGGGTQWTVPSITGDESTPELVGIIVHQCPRGLLWASEDPEEGALPVLVSHDLKTAKLVWPDRIDEGMAKAIAPAGNGEIFYNAAGSELHREYDWAKLPQNEWGTGKKGHGKAVKEQRVLYLLREGDALPLVVNIQPGSLKNWQKFILELSKAGIPFYRAVVRLTLRKEKSVDGQPYSQIVPTLAAVLPPEQGKLILGKLTTAFRDVAAAAFV